MNGLCGSKVIYLIPDLICILKLWYKDIPDQSAIVRQYMRFTAQISSGATTAQVIQRSLQMYASET